MNRSLKHYLSLGVILVGLSSIAPTGLAGPAEPGLKITLRIYNSADVDSETLIRAEHEVTRIYRKIGVDAVWLGQPLLTEKKQEDSPSQQEADIHLNILATAMAECLGTQSSSLGLAPGAGRNRGLAYVFYDRVQDIPVSRLWQQPTGRCVAGPPRPRFWATRWPTRLDTCSDYPTPAPGLCARAGAGMTC